MQNEKALILDSQDKTVLYLAEFLHEKGSEVPGSPTFLITNMGVSSISLIRFRSMTGSNR
jgi:hypothetical protein